MDALKRKERRRQSREHFGISCLIIPDCLLTKPQSKKQLCLLFSQPRNIAMRRSVERYLHTAFTKQADELRHAKPKSDHLALPYTWRGGSLSGRIHVWHADRQLPRKTTTVAYKIPQRHAVCLRSLQLKKELLNC